MKQQFSCIVVASLLFPALGEKLRRTEAAENKHREMYEAPQTRIVGGEQSDLGEFPYYVDMGGCGGSLIAPGVVLSAAHCGSYAGRQVIVGGYEFGETTGGATRVRVIDDAIHPSYNPSTVSNDFLLLRLQEPMNMNTNVVLSINNDYNVPSNGEDLTVLGLGLTSDGGSAPNFLRDVVVKAVSTSVCNAPNRYDGDITDSVMFCAGVSGGGKDSCQGDSGGPIVVRDGDEHIQVGVVSWGYGCAQPNFPGVYARVSSANNWIKSVVCDNWQMPASFCGPTDPPTNPPTKTPFLCNSGNIGLDWTIRTDGWAAETSWTLTDSQGNEIVGGNGYENDESYNTQQCLPNKCYTMTLLDSYGDGLSEGGSDPGYSLVVDGNVIEEAGGDNFGYEVVIPFGNCNGATPPPTPLPTNSPTSARTPSPTIASTPSPTVSTPTNPPACTAGELDFDFTLSTDDWGAETSWVVRNSQGSEILSGDNYGDDQTYSTKQCISKGCYSMTIFDSYGDGLSVGGNNPGYSLMIDGSLSMEAGGDNFGYEVQFDFGDCSGGSSPTLQPNDPTTSPPTTSPPTTAAPTTSPTNSPNGACSNNEVDFEFILTTDDWGTDTTWTLIDSQGYEVLSGGNYSSNETYITTQCIPSECYTLTIFDSFGDGLSDGGDSAGYSLSIDGVVKQEALGENFGTEKVLQFGECSNSPSCTPLTLKLKTDDWANESSFTLTSGGSVIWDKSGFSNNENYEFAECLASDVCNELIVYDSYGDGIVSPGKIEVILDGDVKYQSGDIGYGIKFAYGSC